MASGEFRGWEFYRYLILAWLVLSLVAKEWMTVKGAGSGTILILGLAFELVVLFLVLLSIEGGGLLFLGLGLCLFKLLETWGWFDLCLEQFLGLGLVLILFGTISCLIYQAVILRGHT